MKLTRRASIALAAITVVAAGCVQQQEVAYIEVPTTLRLRTAPPTTRNIRAVKQNIDPVGGTPTSTKLGFAGGNVTVSGIVRDPEGKPVPDAVVVLTRVLGEQRAELRLATNEDGRYVATNVKGGVIQAFAFRSPDLSSGDVKVLFAEGSTKQDLVVQNFSDVEIRWSIGPGQPTVGRPISLTLQLAVRRVDPDGIVRSAALEAISARIVALGALQPTSYTERLTDADGRASFPMQCSGVGTAAVQVFFATGEETSIEPQPCSPPPTTQPPSTLETDAPSTTTVGVPVGPAVTEPPSTIPLIG